MIAVQMPLGKMTHLASSPRDKRTFCGRDFCEDVDEIQEIPDVPTTGRLPEDLCWSCASGNARREQRVAR